MFIGFDYGTANCSVATILDNQAKLLKLEGDSTFIPSALCAPTREAVSEYLYRIWGVQPSTDINERLLHTAISFNREEDIDVDAESMTFGQAALNTYIEDPEDVYYVKSPKSFLGVSGLRDVQVSLFEDLVTAMMKNIKNKAEQELQQDITSTVIGRPVNFQGAESDEANSQAISILSRAAIRVGFKNIEFQFEPVAAGLDYEQTLNEDKTVLIVDIGGGTTDCSMIQMGPSWRDYHDRTKGILSHSGSRIGGNDLDIHLAHRRLMPLLGSKSRTHKGLELPMTQFWNPIAINNIVAQLEFFGFGNRKHLLQMMNDTQEPEKLARLIKLYDEKLSYKLLRDAEQTKIALSEHLEHAVDLSYLDEGLSLSISQSDLTEAIAKPQENINKLVKEAIQQAGRTPDIIYVTGGSARSPILRAALQQQLPNIEIVGGNYFGSVTAGLAHWANYCFG